MGKNNQMYFQNEDAEKCFTEDYFQELMKEAELAIDINTI